MHKDTHNIPQIALTTDLSSTHSLHSSDTQNFNLLSDDIPSPQNIIIPLSSQGGLHPVHARSLSDPSLLSPFPLSPSSPSGRSSLDVPRSPSPTYASSIEASSIIVPPSPTLSTRSSVHFATSVALRDNKPGDGSTSLNLLNTSHKHGRKPSWASSGEGHSSLEGTEPDHIILNPLHRVTSTATSFTAASPTQTHLDHLSLHSGQGSHSPGKKECRDSDGVSETVGRPSGELPPSAKNDQDQDAKNSRVELIDDDLQVNPAPFAFRPYTLASLLDPKNIDLLESLGGVRALLKGLGTSGSTGLGEKALTPPPTDSRPGAGQRHDREVPGIVVTGPEGGVGGKQDDEDARDNSIYAATLDERRQVYGHNFLPRRVSKSLLALMWMALKDKVLACVSRKPLTTPLFIFVYIPGSLVDSRSHFLCSRSFSGLWHDR